MVDSERTAHAISPWTMVCPCHGKPAYRLYEPLSRTSGRYLDVCVRGSVAIGYDVAVRYDDWCFAQEKARRAAVLA